MPTVTFNYTGAQQTWTVPANVTRVTLEVWGAQGGENGGKGGYAKGDLNVNSGQILYLYVGGAGGWNGGGLSLNFDYNGGGASDVRYGGTTLDHRVIVGGGGGANGAGGGVGASVGLDGGGLSGQQISYASQGSPGTQSSGGSGGTSDENGTDGEFGSGGVGSTRVYYGGGGGGGWYGGGGGGGSDSSENGAGGGGGGSGYIGGVTNATMSTGVRSGHGLIVITYTFTPTAPTNLSPSGGISINRGSVQRLSWQFNDPDSGDSQSKFDLQWRLVGELTWNEITEVTINQYWDAPANTFPHGDIEWRVRTYDQEDLSGPYSSQATFFAGDQPSPPTITSPTDGEVIPISQPTVQWSSSGQIAYQVQVLNSDGSNYWLSDEFTSTNKAHTVGAELANNTDYTLRVRIKNVDVLWSDWANVDITVSYTPPATPEVTVTGQGAGGYIQVNITNPIPTGTEPSITTNNLYRKKQGETDWERIVTGITENGTYSDYATASGVAYEYKVRANGDNGTYSDSETKNGSITLRGVWLHDVADPSGTIHRFVYDGAGRSSNWEADATLMQFAGRKRPIVEFGESAEGRISVQLQMLKEDADWKLLDALVRRRGTICFRDGRGRKMFGVITALPITDETWGYTTSIEVIETSYAEAV